MAESKKLNPIVELRMVETEDQKSRVFACDDPYAERVGEFENK